MEISAAACLSAVRVCAALSSERVGVILEHACRQDNRACMPSGQHSSMPCRLEQRTGGRHAPGEG